MLPTAPGHPDRAWRSKETLALAAQTAILAVVQRYGMDRTRFVIDRDTTQIQRGLRHQKADSTRGFFLDIGPGQEPVRVEPVVEDDPLLQIADVYAYTTLRARSCTPGRWFADLFAIVRPNIRQMAFSCPEPWADSTNQAIE
jgi:hypothetical protein